MPRLFRADWVLPIARPPLRDGWVITWAGRVIACGGGVPAARQAPVESPFEAIDLGRAAIMPGLVNAHAHLELSWMRNRVPPASSMSEWAARLLDVRNTIPTDAPAAILDAVRQVRRSGTSLIGDVTNTFGAYGALVDSGLSGAVFCELLGFNAFDPHRLVSDAQSRASELTPIERLRVSLAPHAPYSVSPELIRAIADASTNRPISIHVGESPEEVQFLRDGTGPWRALLERLGVWNPKWQPPRCRPLEYLDRLGVVSERLVAVHCVHLTDGELARLRDAGGTVVTCPRSNTWTGAGEPPVARFYASGVRVAIGTDSLASVADLNIFAEVAAVRRLAPNVPAARLLESATRHGADALGFGDHFGTIEPAKCADLIAVRVPAHVVDVEQYLVGGVEPQDVTWLDTQ